MGVSSFFIVIYMNMGVWVGLLARHLLLIKCMNTNALTNMFAADMGVVANPAKTQNSMRTGKFNYSQKNDWPKTDDTQAPAVENMYEVAQQNAPDEPEKGFCKTITEAIAAQKTNEVKTKAKNENTEKSQKNHIYGAATKLTPEQLELAQHFVTNPAALAKGKAAQKTLVKPKNAENSAKIPDNPEESTATTEAKQGENKPLITIDRERLGKESISHGNADAEKTIEITPGQGKDTANIQTSAGPAEVKIAVNQQNTQDIADKAQAALDNAKPLIANQQLSSENVQNRRQVNSAMPKTQSAGEKPAEEGKNGAGKVTAFEVPKASAQNEEAVPGDGRAYGEQQKLANTFGKPAFEGNNPDNNGAATNKQNETLQQVAADTPKNQQAGAVVDNLIKDLNPKQVEVTASQGKGKVDLPVNDNSNMPNFAQALSQNNHQQAVAEQAVAASAKTATQTSVGEQIQESVTASLREGDNEITIRLDPPELGKVTIKFQEQDGQLTGELRVSKAETRFEVEQALPAILRNLQQSGVQIKRIEVVLNNNTQQESFKEQMNHEGAADQQHGSNFGSNQNNSSNGRWSPDIFASSYMDLNDPYQMQTADDAINVLV